MKRCGKYLGDNDATCPQLTCIRDAGHPGLCDNVSDAPGADPRLAKDAQLLASIKRAMPALKTLLDQANDHWGAEDGVYRFYHQSFKVYWLQDQTTTIVNVLAALADGPLSDYFTTIVDAGTGKTFEQSHNSDWLRHTRPIVEAYFHAHYFLTMVVKYGTELEEAPSVMPSGWAAVLSLYGQR